jgi:predicted Zn-dependent peptidase
MVCPSPPRLAALPRPPARGRLGRVLCLALASVGCGATPTGPGPLPPVSGKPAPTTSSHAFETHLLDVTVRAGASTAVLIAGIPTSPTERPAARARLAAYRAALSRDAGGPRSVAEVEVVDGVPALRIEVPASAYLEALAMLRTTLDAPVTTADPETRGPAAALPGDVLDALGAEAAPPGRPGLVVVRGALSAADEAREAELFASIGGRLSALASGRPPARNATAAPGPKVRVLRRGGRAAYLALAVALPGDDAITGAELIAALLAGAPESRLERALAGAGLEGATAATALRRSASGPALVVGLTLRPDDAEAGWRLVASVRRALRETPPTSSEAARARAHLADRVAFARGTTAALAAHRAARIFLTDDAVPDESENAARLDALTTAGIGRLADELAAAPIRGLLVTPSVESEVDDDLWAESLAEAAGSGGPPAVAAPEVRPGVFRLADGLSAVVHTRPGDTLVAIEVRLSGGASLEPPELPGVGVLAAAVAGRPAEHRALEVDWRFERDAVVLTVTAPAERFSEAVDLLGRRLARFPQRADVFEEARARVETKRAQRQAEPLALAFALAEQGFFDPRLGRDLLGTPSGLAERTPIEARSFLEARIAARPMTITVVGPVEPPVALPTLRATFAALAADAPSESGAPPAPPATHLERPIDAARTCVAAAFPMPVPRAAGERQDAVGDLLAVLLRPARHMRGPNGAALLVGRCADDATAARVALATDLGRLATSGPTPIVLETARRAAEAEFARACEAPAGLATRLSEGAARGLAVGDDDPVARGIDRLEAVTPPEIRTLAAALPPLDAAVIGIAGRTAGP